MTSIEFHSSFRRDCESCGYIATHGFVLIEGRVATFECTSCAQRHVERTLLDAAIEAHRQFLFTQNETRSARNGVASGTETVIFNRPSHAETTIFSRPNDETIIRARPSGG
jgi:hypothetical protein